MIYPRQKGIFQVELRTKLGPHLDREEEKGRRHKMTTDKMRKKRERDSVLS